jgi:hypothetical protein
MKSVRLACLVSSVALGLGSAALPVLASSTAASSASEGASASVGSVSTSFETSSDSSKKDKTAAGDYKLIDVAEVAERPGTLRLTLQPVTAAAEAKAGDNFILYVPAQVVVQNAVATGQVVSAKPRAYGVEFAKAETGRAFFLVLNDEWHRELQSNAVTL